MIPRPPHLGLTITVLILTLWIFPHRKKNITFSNCFSILSGTVRTDRWKFIRGMASEFIITAFPRTVIFLDSHLSNKF